MRAAGTACAFALAVVAALGLSGCGPAENPARTAVPSTTAAAATSAAASTSAAEPSASAALRQAMDTFNATAGGPVLAQQAVLAGLISAGQTAQQRACPAATTTVTFDPVYARLAPSPGWRPAAGSLPGTVYAVPALIRIYTGDRITGTDLTDLHLAIEDGRVRWPATCLR